MTTRPSSSDTAASRPIASFTELGARLRRSIVAVRAGALESTGVALGSGLVVTSHDAVRYLSVVALRRDDGTEVDARVIHADVGADLALLWPIDRFEMPPLRRSSRAAQLGQAIAVVSRLGDGALRLEPGHIIEPERVEAGRGYVVVQGPGPSSGSPLVDGEGRVLGLFGRRRDEGVAVPLAVIERFFTEAQRGGGLSERFPTYRCPSCDEAFAPDRFRCSSCGHPLPYNEAGEDERLVGEALAPIGVVPANVYVGPGHYRVLAVVPDAPEIGRRVVDVRRSAAAGRWSLRCSVMPVPSASGESLYRLLLTMNDATTGPTALGIDAQDVALSCAVSCADPAQLSPHLVELVRRAAYYERELGSRFGR